MIEQGIIDLLNADAAMSSLIHSCIYQVLVPQDAKYPCLSLHVVSASSDYTFEGRVFSEKQIQFDAWGESYHDAAAVRQALRNILNAYSGTLSEGTRILGAFGGNEIDFFEGDSYKFRAVAEFTFRYTEP